MHNMLAAQGTKDRNKIKNIAHDLWGKAPKSAPADGRSPNIALNCLQKMDTDTITIFGLIWPITSGRR